MIDPMKWHLYVGIYLVTTTFAVSIPLGILLDCSPHETKRRKRLARCVLIGFVWPLWAPIGVALGLITIIRIAVKG